MSTPDETRSSEAAIGVNLSDRSLATWEIISVTSSILIAEWIMSAATGRNIFILAIPTILAFVLIISSHFLRGESVRDLGFRFDNFFRALKLLLLPMILIAGLSVLIGYLGGSRPDFFRGHSEKLIIVQLAAGFGWGFVQQYVLQGFINRRAQIAWRAAPVSILVTAIVFSALHLPNPWLMLITFVGGVVWAFVYQRAPNLFALALSHSVMTWILVSTLPPSALNHLRIGFKYFA